MVKRSINSHIFIFQIKWTLFETVKEALDDLWNLFGFFTSRTLQHLWRSRMKQAALTRNWTVFRYVAFWQTKHDLNRAPLSMFGQTNEKLAFADNKMKIKIWMFIWIEVQTSLFLTDKAFLLWSDTQHTHAVFPLELTMNLF